MLEYRAKEIEKKWQEKWEKDQTYLVEDNQTLPKYYILDMFPYPSGEGLHVGHPLGYIASDIVSRYKKHLGFNVLHPMGYDSFGLPAEQFAIQTGKHPSLTTQTNIKRIKNNFSFIQEIEWGKLIESDILINATSVGLSKNDKLNIDFKSIKPKKLFYDVIYNPPETKFLEKAKNLGHNTLNGKSMFLYQAQKAFQIWHDIVPKIDKNILNFFEND